MNKKAPPRPKRGPSENDGARVDTKVPVITLEHTTGSRSNPLSRRVCGWIAMRRGPTRMSRGSPNWGKRALSTLEVSELDLCQRLLGFYLYLRVSRALSVPGGRQGFIYVWDY